MPATAPQRGQQAKQRPVGFSLRKSEKQLILGTIVLLAVLTLAWVGRVAQVNDLQYRLILQERRAVALEKENASLRIEANRLSSASRVEAVGAELGLQWPTRTQIKQVTSVPGH